MRDGARDVVIPFERVFDGEEVAVADFFLQSKSAQIGTLPTNYTKENLPRRR